MTTVNVKLAKENGLSNLEAGSFVKRDGQLFIVAMVEQAISNEPYFSSYEDAIESALYSPRSSKIRYSQSVTRKYNVVNVQNGKPFYDENYKMSYLIDKLKGNAFQKVNGVEIAEI